MLPIGLPPKSTSEIVDAFAREFTSQTKIISVGHTVFIPGLIIPLGELGKMAQEKEVLVLILGDSAHGLGMLSLNMKELGVDFFASSPYKWMGAPTGVGLLYVRKEDKDKLWPTIFSSGWDASKGAKKYEL